MKSLILGMGLGMLSLFILVSVISIETKSDKEIFLEQVTRDSAYQTLKECSEKSTWFAIWNQYAEVSEDKNEIMSVRFKENLKKRINSDDIVKVKILAADQAEGVLRVQTSLTYNNMGKVNTVNAEETVIYDYAIP